VERAVEDTGALEAALAALEGRFREEFRRALAGLDPAALAIEARRGRPSPTGVSEVSEERLALAWLPFGRSPTVERRALHGL
jgi:hypothetical protein